MRAFLAFILSICVQSCCGRYFNRRVFEPKPGIPMRDFALLDEGIPMRDFALSNKGIPMRDFALLDEVCEDDPNYAADCPKHAAIDNYCKDQEKFMMKNCPKSCGFCKEESIKPPAPAAVCEDDPNYAADCPKHAAIENYCKDQEKFMMKNCPKSCGFCKEESVKPPAPAAATVTPAVSTETAKPPTPAATVTPAVSTETAKPPTPAETAKPPAPAVCEDDPDYADGCPEKAAIKNYCKDQEEFMRKYCPMSCGFCSNATVQPAAVSTECKDDPEYEERCKDIAVTTGLCEEQRIFTQEHCPLSCEWCESPITKAPIQGICEEDLPKWAHRCPVWAKMGKCDDPFKQPFLWHYCRKSCKLPCKTEPPPIPGTKPPSPPAFCRDRDLNCHKWKALGLCGNHDMPIYCGVTCDICKEPTPDECVDKIANCEDFKKDGSCTSSVPITEYEVKTNCLKTCEFCVPDVP